MNPSIASNAVRVAGRCRGIVDVALFDFLAQRFNFGLLGVGFC